MLTWSMPFDPMKIKAIHIENGMLPAAARRVEPAAGRIGESWQYNN
jgi:hypothetical protein